MKSEKKFSELGLSEKTLEAINQKGFEEPTSIQSMTIPVMLRDDTNIIAQAQTGTGKTAAFGLPLIDMINDNSPSVQALVLVPTRELAIQVSEEINSLKGKSGIKIAPIYGGQAIGQQLRRLKQGVHIVVGTPGRVIDHLNRRTLKLGGIEHLVLDEADEMLNMGFIEEMEEIMKHTNPDKRTLLFSATMPQKIKTLAGKYMDGYELIKVDKAQLTTNLTEQIYFEVKASERFDALCRIIDIEENFYGLVFCRTKSDVDYVASHLKDRGYDAEAIHGDLSQRQRETTLNKFKQQKSNILIATDVAARGLDVNNLTHVINYSLPQDPEAYVHRIGRTGRAGNEGTAITFITPSEYKKLMFFQRIAKTDIKKASLPKVKDIINAKKKKINEDIIAKLDGKVDKEFFNWSKALLSENEPTEILAAVLSYCFEEDLSFEAYGDIKDIGAKDRQVDQQGKTRLFISMGKKDKMTPRKLVDLVLTQVPIKAKHVSDILVMDSFSFVTVPFAKAERIVEGFKRGGGKPIVELAKDAKKGDKGKSDRRDRKDKKNRKDKKSKKDKRG